MSSGASTGSRGLFAEIVRLQRAGQRAALVTPLWSSGSVPLSAESKLLLREDGSALGTVGGGALEAKALAGAREVLAGAEAQVLDFELSQDEAAESGMICGGRCALLVEPIVPDRQAAVFAVVAEAERSRDGALLVTVIEPEGQPQKLAFSPGRGLTGTTGDVGMDAALAEIAQECLARQRPRYATEPIRAHYDPIVPHPVAFIFGAGHVAVPVAHLADLVGFRVVVVDDRAEFANRERFPRAEEVMVAGVAEAFQRLPIEEDAYIVAVTRGHAMDEDVVAEALQTPARYVGMIGSRRKVAAVSERLRKRGYSEEDLSRLRAPIGIDIGADTVEEIAVSIVAEMIAVRRQTG
jgi:xanthine dehydrogenase accessory factor